MSADHQGVVIMCLQESAFLDRIHTKHFPQTKHTVKHTVKIDLEGCNKTIMEIQGKYKTNK